VVEDVPVGGLPVGRFHACDGRRTYRRRIRWRDHQCASRPEQQADVGKIKDTAQNA
jgi:hypothetical protein